MAGASIGRRPPSIAKMWTVSYQGVFVGAFKTRAELDGWLERIGTPDSVIRAPRDELVVANPSGLIV